ncbi:MAG: HAMP domain-containing sensor histidine kinase [Planctomycetota bacterium]
MSYRTFKRALGETGLERKCRWIFGVSLLVLIMGSFWWYGRETNKQIFKRNRFIGEALVTATLVEAHFNKQESIEAMQVVDETTARYIRGDLYRWAVLHPDNPDGLSEPTDEYEWELMSKWQRLGKQLSKDTEIEALEEWDDRILPVETPPGADSEEGSAPQQQYRYYEPVYASNHCIGCHSTVTPVVWPDLQIGDLLAVVRVDMDAEEIVAGQTRLHTIMLSTAIVTAFASMVAMWVIVRYIIVKPLRHLRDVSNAVRRGDVEQRAVIHTGDEFEELGAAFNRMLRQLLRHQDELKGVNSELDGKIDELAQANMRLFEMNKVKGDFLATVSHELRTPLNSIIGFSDLLVGVDALDDKQRRFASNIQNSGKQLLRMINDILDLAKMESGRMDVGAEEFEIGTLVSSQTDLARPLSEKKNIDLDYEIDPGLPPLRQDRGKIEQVLNNLLSNAIKFTPDGGRVHVTASRDASGDLRLAVEDTGVGIGEADRARVFEKFRQGASVLPSGTAMTREFSGTGLGLSIVREICRLLGGDITLESELGKGSTFTVVLPWQLTELPGTAASLVDDLRGLTAAGASH